MINETLSKVLGALGWGDPSGGLFFVGLEGGEAWANQGEVDSYLRREATVRIGEAIYEHFPPPKDGDDKPRDSRSQVWLWESKIASALSKSVDEPYAYSRRCLWYDGFGVFHANLYPLGKPRLNQWPSHYQDLFGLGPADQERYKLVVRKKRFPLLRQFQLRHRPQATICFGKTCWTEFEDLFDLWESPADADSDKDIRLYSDKRTMLIPFLGVGQMSDELARRIIANLTEWNVSLP